MQPQKVDRRPYAVKHLRLSYLGICMYQVWGYCVIVRTDINFGGANAVTISNIALAAALLVFTLIKVVMGDRHIERILGWPTSIAAALCTCALTYPGIVNEEGTGIACIVAGVCMGFMLLSWIPFFIQIDLHNAIFCMFAAGIAGAALKLLIDFSTPLPATILLTVFPLLSAWMLRDAMNHLPPEESKPQMFFDFSADSLLIAGRLLTGIAVFSLIVGVVPSVAPHPNYSSAEEMALVYHSAELVASALVLWWVFRRHGSLRFAHLWRIILLITATGLFFLPVLGSEGSRWAQILIAVAQTLAVMLVMLMLFDTARHSTTSPYLIVGFAWFCYSVPLALGQIIGNVIAGEASSTYLTTLLAYALMVVAMFALNENSLVQSRIFADIDVLPESTASPLFATVEEGCAELGRRYGLSDREVEVMQLLCSGRSKSYVAETLFISENTVRSHARHIYQKLEVHSKQEMLDMVAQLH